MYVDNLVNKHGIFLRIINSLIFIIFCIDMISAQSFQLTPFPECDLNINVKKGLSSPCVGVHNDCLFLAGGCNFPDLPIIQGGKKRFYDDIYIISSVSEGNTVWRSAGKLPYSLAYGVTLSTPYGIIIIGGCNESGSINNVLNVNWDVERNSLKVDSVNQLPYEMFNMGGTYCDECCYIAGGIVDGIPSNKFFVLYNDSNKGWKWEELEDFPGSPRVQPIVVALTVYGKKRIYIWGGFSTSSKYTSSNISVDGYYYDVDERTWHYAGFISCEGTNSPISVGGGVGIALNDSVMFVTGGVNELKFRESLDIDDRLFKAMNNHNEILIKKYQEMAKEYMTHPFEWYDFNNRLMIYDAEKCKWRILGKHSAFSLVGSPGICRIGDDVYIINGEIKPGIRTSQNWKLNIRVEDLHN